VLVHPHGRVLDHLEVVAELAHVAVDDQAVREGPDRVAGSRDPHGGQGHRGTGGGQKRERRGAGHLAHDQSGAVRGHRAAGIHPGVGVRGHPDRREREVDHRHRRSLGTLATPGISPASVAST
jgi:hypothetical protein